MNTLQRRAHRGIRPLTRSATYWTRERVLVALKLFFERHGFAPTSTEAWHAIVGGTGLTHRRDYPSFYGVLRWFSSFREAWTAAGVTVNRSHEPWTEEEEWYLREATGILSRKQIAIDLRRSEDSVHRRQYDIGLNARTRWGWALHRAAAALKLPEHRLRTHVDRGDLPYFRGSCCIYIDPADIIGLGAIDWRCASKEIKEAARHSLMERLAKIVAGVAWRAGRFYQSHPIHHRRHKLRLVRNQRKPKYIREGDTVRVIGPLSGKRLLRVGRQGTVKLVHFSTDPREGWGGWRARVEFKKEKRHGRDERRVTYSIPLTALNKVRKK